MSARYLISQDEKGRWYLLDRQTGEYFKQLLGFELGVSTTWTYDDEKTATSVDDDVVTIRTYVPITLPHFTALLGRPTEPGMLVECAYSVPSEMVEINGLYRNQ